MSIGGFSGPSYAVEWDGTTLRYESGGDGYSNSRKSALDPTPGQWNAFFATLDVEKVWNWRAEYFAHFTDGTTWELRIGRGGKRVASRGSNAYPDGRGSIAEEPSASFARVLLAVSKLAGDRPFE